MVCHFPRKKLFRGTRNRQRFWFSPSEFYVFRETKNARNSFQSDSAKDKKTRNSVPNHFLEDKNTWNFVILFRTISRKILWNSFRTISQKRKTLGIFYRVKRKSLSKLVPNHSRTKKNKWMSFKKHFFAQFRSVPYRTSEWAIPRLKEFRERITFIHGITKTVPSLFRRFFWNWVSVATLVWIHYIHFDYLFYFF